MRGVLSQMQEPDSGFIIVARSQLLLQVAIQTSETMGQQGQRMLLASAFLVLQLMALTAADQCGEQAGGASYPGGLCCNEFGLCGTTSDHCGGGCQSNCGVGGGGGGTTGKASFYTVLYVPRPVTLRPRPVPRKYGATI